MKYLNFDLEVFNYTDTNYVESFNVRVSASPAGQQKVSASERVQLPPDIRSQQRMLDRRGYTFEGMVRFGTMLGDVLFSPAVRRLYELSHARLREEQGLRVRINCDHPALANLPWEYVYLPRSEGAPNALEGFLALDRRTSLVRLESMEQPLTDLEPVTGDLRFVALMASPVTLEPLRLERERTVIEEALNTLPSVRQSFYAHATTNSLLDAFASPAHVFHFAGHALFQASPPGATQGAGATEPSGGFLFFEDEQRRHVPFPADRLALILKNTGVRLAMLGGCQTAQRDGVNPWSGVAPALVRAGIPAVIGMQFKVYDNNAIIFNRQFYQALLQGQEIDFAMNAGRLAILSRNTENDRDWGAPVLYMRNDDGVLFPASTAQRPPDALTVPRTPRATRKAKPGELPLPRVPMRQPGSAGAGQGAMRGAELLEAPVDSMRVKMQLRDVLVTHFNVVELELLCQALGVGYEAISGNTRMMRALNLVQYMTQRGRLPLLIDTIRRRRPGVL
jgi:hypothetical protein